MARINSTVGCGCRRALQSSGVTYAGVTYADSSEGGSNCWPYYCGPCPGTQPVPGCGNYCRGTNGLPCSWQHNCDGGWRHHMANGFFTQTAEVSLAAGGIVPFTGINQSVGLMATGGQIRFNHPGIYLAQYAVNNAEEDPVPVTAPPRLQLTLNGMPIPGSDIRLPEGGSAFGQAIFEAVEGTILSLAADGPATIEPENAGDTIVSLTVQRLD